MHTMLMRLQNLLMNTMRNCGCDTGTLITENMLILLPINAKAIIWISMIGM